MKITAGKEDGVLRLALTGELDHHAAKTAMRTIESAIDRELPRRCVLDFTDLRFMDSSGIAVILKTQRRMAELGGSAMVENVPPQPGKVLSAAHLDRIVRIRRREEETV